MHTKHIKYQIQWRKEIDRQVTKHNYYCQALFNAQVQYNAAAEKALNTWDRGVRGRAMQLGNIVRFYRRKRDATAP
jgi:hypothetical protein